MGFSGPYTYEFSELLLSFHSWTIALMDLLCNAYSNSSDEEPEPEPGPQPSPVLRPQFRAEYRTVAVPPSKRPKPDSFRSEAPIPGRYLSKRERGLLAQAQAAPASARLDQNLNLPPPTSPGKSIFLSCMYISSYFLFFFFFNWSYWSALVLEQILKVHYELITLPGYKVRLVMLKDKGRKSNSVCLVLPQ